MPIILPKPLNSNATWPEIYAFKDKLRSFVEACYPDNEQKAAAAWEFVQARKSIGTVEDVTMARQSDVVARYNAIQMVLDSIGSPNAKELENSFAFRL